MATPILGFRETQRWNDYVMHPGIVGSVGDVNPTPFLKTSCIDLPRRMEKTFRGKKALPLGSMIQNGSSIDWMTGGLGPRTIDSNWDLPRTKVPIANGFVIQDVSPADMLVEPLVSSIGDFSWRNKLAKVQDRVTGFEQVPGEYTSTGIPRGGQVPRIVDWDLGNEYDSLTNRQPFYGFNLPEPPRTFASVGTSTKQV